MSCINDIVKDRSKYVDDRCPVFPVCSVFREHVSQDTCDASTEISLNPNLLELQGLVIFDRFVLRILPGEKFRKDGSKLENVALDDRRGLTFVIAN
ncbi:MAG TPA: hypothetical protein VGN57_02885 [Pirellulaceae bacterium]|jgi:hypothetical protein|nr:hypothetical protein [Pirellulaceae bacterium]